MSKLHGCPCGATQSDVSFPTHNKIHVISDDALDAATDYVRKTIDRDAFRRARAEGYFCSQCGRLLILEGDKLRIFEELGVRYGIFPGPGRPRG